jgi:HSP20 family molecular chaperone IbpA
MIRHNDLFAEIDSIFNSFFFNFPKEIKPPAAYKILKDDLGKTKGFLLQVAVAGFEEKDLKVWSEDNVLFVEGDNSSNEEVVNRFKNKFSWQIQTANDVDLDNVAISFKNGLLSLDIPIKTKEKNKRYLLGSATT